MAASEYVPILGGNTPQQSTINYILQSLGSAAPVVNGDNPQPILGWVPPTNRDVDQFSATSVLTGGIALYSSDFPSAVAAVAAAKAGQTVVITPGLHINPPGLGNGITVLNDNVTVIVTPGAEILVQTWGQPGIDCIGRNGVKITGGGIVRYVGVRGDHTGTVRGGAAYTACAAVYINGDRCTVDDLRSIDMPTGVYLSSWDGASIYGHVGVKNKVVNFETQGMDFGILYTRQESFTFDHIYGHDDIDDSSGINPTHIIYGSPTQVYRASGLTVSNLIADRILFGQPYQFKYTDTVTASNFIARNSRGLANIQGCSDFRLDVAISTGTLPTLTAPNGAITIQDMTTTRNSLSNITIVAGSAGVDQRLFLLAGSDCSIENLQIVSKRLTGSGSGIAQVWGDRNTVKGASFTEISAFSAVGLVMGDIAGTYSTNNVLVEGLQTSGVYSGVDFYGPISGTFRYNRANLAASFAAFRKLGAQPNTLDIFRDNILTVTGTPEGNYAAPVGTVVQRDNGGASTSFYIKEAGSGNTGWRAV